MAGWSDLDGFGPNNERISYSSGAVNTISISPYTTWSYPSGVTELKRRITVKKFDADGNVVEETVTEEYGDKEIVTIPSFPVNPAPYNPTPSWPNTIYCNTAGFDVNAAVC